MIHNARRCSKDSKVIFRVEDVTNINFDNNSFDAVVIANALHILPNPNKALEEIH